MIVNIGISIAVLAAIVFFSRDIEKKNIYFPTRAVEQTPAVIDIAYDDVSFLAGDGVRLSGWFVPPANDRSPVVLFSHGNGGNISHRLESIRIFAGLGMGVFIYDYRGYGTSEGSPTEEGTYKDAKAAYEYLIKDRTIASDRIVLFGESLGGAISIDLASEVPVGAVITLGAFSSIAEMARQVYPFIPKQLIDRFLKIRYDSVSKIGAVRPPKLIVHAADDDIIPFRQGVALFRAAREPKSFLEIRGDHNSAVIADSGTFVDGVQKFLARHGLLSDDVS
ncbi:MAG: alpha/beta hydrolase [Candidatus Omnitrophota bacterium]